MSNQPKPSDNRTAVQRLTDLENAIMSLFNVNDNLARDVMALRDSVKMLDNKLNSVVKASRAGEPLTDEVLRRIMIESNAEELAQRVAIMEAQGLLKKEEKVGQNSFVVGMELNEDGSVGNPRLQFALKALSPDLQAKLLGAKPGDLVHIKDGTFEFKVLESYEIVPPKDENPDQSATPAAQPDTSQTATEPATEDSQADSTVAPAVNQ